MKLIKLLLDKKLIKESEVDNNDSFSDMKTRCLGTEEIVNYLNNIFEYSNLSDKEKRKYYTNNSKEKKEKNSEDELENIRNSNKNFKLPYIHSSTVKKAMNNEFLKFMNDDEKKVAILQTFYKIITDKPQNLFSINQKMEKTSGEQSMTVNIGIPSITGIIAKKTTSLIPVFEVLDTCPGAGPCKVHCYTTVGNYIKFDEVFLKQTRVLNFLINHRQDFINKAVRELSRMIDDTTKKDKTLNFQIRWNDAGDIFSKGYYEAIVAITDKLVQKYKNKIKQSSVNKNGEIVDLKKDKNIGSYLYTKSADILSPDLYKDNKNIHVIYSINNAKPSEIDKLMKYAKEGHTLILSFVLPTKIVREFFDFKDKKFKENLVDDYMVKIDKNIGEYLMSRPRYGNFYLDEYNKAEGGLILLDDLKNIDEGVKPIYNVLVLPGESDLAAQRKDVKNICIIYH